MYNFFTSNLKYKAFKKALKEVEAEGFDVDFSVDTNSVAVLPDISANVAALNKEDEHVQKTDTSFDVTAIADETLTVPNQSSTNNSEMATSGEYFGSLFADSPTFLNGETTQNDVEFLSGEQEDYTIEKQRAINPEAVNEHRQSTFERLAKKRLQESMVKNTVVKQEPAKLEEQPKPQETKPPKLIVEVVAPPKEEKQPAVKPKKKAGRKPKASSKKKRKYDADIVGDFDF